MKHGNKFYIQLTRELFTDKYKNLSINAKWLFVVLNELEHQYVGDYDFFYRSDELLAKDAGMSLPTLKRCKNELRNSGLVEISTCHFIFPDGKKSEKRVTTYRIIH